MSVPSRSSSSRASLKEQPIGVFRVVKQNNSEEKTPSFQNIHHICASSRGSSQTNFRERSIEEIPVSKRSNSNEYSSSSSKESFQNIHNMNVSSKESSIKAIPIAQRSDSTECASSSNKESFQNIRHICASSRGSSSQRNFREQSIEEIPVSKRNNSNEYSSSSSKESFQNIHNMNVSSKESSSRRNFREQSIEVIPIAKRSDSNGCASYNNKEQFLLRKDASCNRASSTENPKSYDEILNQNDFSETESENEIVLSAFWHKSKFGAAYFNIKTSEIYVLNEIFDAVPEHYMLRNFYRQVQPMCVLTGGHPTRSFVNCLKSLISENKPINATDESDSSKKNGLLFLPRKDYNFEACKYRVYQLSLPNESAHFSENDHQTFLNSILNFNYKLTIHALGALLLYLDRNWQFLKNDLSSAPSILGINTVSLDKIVTMNNETYKALQIFNKRSHPSSFNKGIAHNDKEGISLFFMFNRCCTKIGMQYLRLMLKHPTNDIKVIQRRLDTITFINTPGNEDFVRSIRSCLTYIKNVNGIMTRIKGLIATPIEWQLLFNTIYNAVLICEICENFKSHSSLLNALGSKNNTGLYSVAHNMKSIIDFDLSKMQGRFTIKLGLCSELDKKKQMMMGLEDFLTSTANLELQKLPDYVGDCMMVYLPNLGYMIGVKIWKSHLNEDEKELPDLTFMCQDENFLYYKSKGCEEIDYTVGDTYSEIIVQEMKIMRRLTEFILKHFHVLSSIVKLCAELDCIISMAKVCKDLDYKRPTLTFEKIIDIKQGRHPIQELFVETFIPNDTLSTSGKHKVTLLTGPNSCGKSVYLKQVAMIVYMTHIGSFVPAESATIGLVDHIFTRVQTTENISMRMSAFSIDLRQISQAVEGATSSSLVIIDEFGKGTNEIDGLGLLAACVNSFILSDANCPHVFISTHFHDLPQYLAPSQNLRLLCMDYMLKNKTAIYLYKLKEGISKKSFAINVAEHIGLDPEICNRARYVLKHLNQKTVKAKKISVKNNTFHFLESSYFKTVQKIESGVCGIVQKFGLEIIINIDKERYPLADESLEKYTLQENIIFTMTQLLKKEKINQKDLNKLLSLVE